jgi:hypothetical protein
MFGIDQSARSHGGLFSFFLHLCGPLLLEETLQADALGLVYPGNPLLYRGGSTGIYGFRATVKSLRTQKKVWNYLALVISVLIMAIPLFWVIQFIYWKPWTHKPY